MKQTHIVTALLLCIALGNVRAQYYKTYKIIQIWNLYIYIRIKFMILINI